MSILLTLMKIKVTNRKGADGMNKKLKMKNGMGKRMKVSAVIGILVFAGFVGIMGLTTENASADTWNIETVDVGVDGDRGYYISMALDSNDYAHISYFEGYDDDLKYAKWTGSSWNIETVDSEGNVGRYTSIAVDSNDYPHISYFNSSYDDLKYAHWTGSSWNIETVDSLDYVGQYTSIAVDGNNYPHISYFDNSNDDLKYANWTGSSWNIETVDSLGYVGEYTSIAVDNNNYPHISYFDNSNDELKYANWTGSSWNIETVDSEGYVGLYTSIALDGNDYPHISYYNYTGQDLKYAQWTGSSWDIETVHSGPSVGQYTSIALDSNGYPHISYRDITNTTLKYAYWTGSSWSFENLQYGWMDSISIDIDSSDYPHIIYDGDDSIEYFRRTGSGWNLQYVSVNSGRVGEYTSIAIDTSGNPYISYYDNWHRDLKLAKWTGMTWSIDIVDFFGHCGYYNSLALDSSDYPHISYFDDSRNDLKYAHWTGSSWNIETVDSEWSVGLYTSIALDGNNYPHISYYDIEYSDLKYARWTGSAWSIETVDSAGLLGRYNSIAIDSSDNPHISYYDEFNGIVKYAKWLGGSWSIETVDSEGTVGQYTCLFLDTNDNPHISYFDQSKNNLKYAKWVGSWVVQTVDPAIYSGLHTSIALDGNNYAHISYYDELNRDLKYAKITSIDNLAPISSVNEMSTYITAPSFTITADASDFDGSVDEVELWYKKDYGGWTLYGTDTASPWSWDFNTSTTGGDGTYEFYSIALDNMALAELPPSEKDAWTEVDTGILNILPVSSVNPLPQYETATSFMITATALDLDGNVSQVELWYKKDSGDWNLYGTDTTLPWAWEFDTESTSGMGKYQFYSRAMDNIGAWEVVNPATNDTWTIVDESHITVDTEPPNADAGTDKNIDTGDLVNFDGGGSNDNVDSIFDLNFAWKITKNGDLIATLYGVNPTYKFDETGSYEVNLTVIDSSGNEGYDTMTVRVTKSTTPSKSMSDFLTEYWWLFLVLVVAVIAAIIAVLLLARRKKKEPLEIAPETLDWLMEPQVAQPPQPPQYPRQDLPPSEKPLPPPPPPRLAN